MSIPRLALLVGALSLFGGCGAETKLGGVTGGGTGGGVTFVPTRVVDFDGLVPGGPVAARVDFWGAQGTNGFGTFASDSVTRPNKSSAAELRIQAGTTGRTGDGSPAVNGDFGFGLQIPDADRPGEGDDLWVGLWLRVPSGFSYQTNTGVLKFMRVIVTGTGGKIDHHLAESGGMHTGYNLASEFDPKPRAETRFVTPGLTFVTDQWVWFEAYVHLSSDPMQAVRRVWVDDTLVLERVGDTLRHRDSGQMVTLTVSPERSLPAASERVSGLMIFTYWNGTSPRDQSIFVQTVVYQSRVAPPFVDAEGSPRMGRAFAETL